MSRIQSRRLRRVCARAALIVTHVSILTAPALAVTPPLPQPLTLEDALRLGESLHPDVGLARAQYELARAEEAATESRVGARAFIDLTPQTVTPATESAWVDDSRARIVFNKPLYDFGRQRALVRAAALNADAREQNFIDTRAQRRVEIMARFFDVLLADLRYAVDNETMASNYVAFDQARERREIGQLSDIQLLESENRYQEARVRRSAAEAEQRNARMRLALALDRPDELPSELAAPALAELMHANSPLPEFKDVWARLREHNPRLLAQRHELEGTHAAMTAERARRRPTLSAEAEAAYYEREFLSRDERRATLNLRIPLYQGGEDRAASARAAAKRDEAEARLRRLEFELRQALWELLQEIESMKIHQQAATVRANYRELYLDRSRALYELELRTELGDAMIRTTEAAWLAAQADYRLALAWARLEALVGAPIAQTPAPAAVSQELQGGDGGVANDKSVSDTAAPPSRGAATPAVPTSPTAPPSSILPPAKEP